MNMTNQTVMPTEIKSEAQSGSGDAVNSVGKLCRCGCGTKIYPDERGNTRNWVRGHAAIGKKQSPEWVANKAAAMKRAWADQSKMQRMRRQSPELVEKRIAKLRGRKLSQDRIEKIRKDIKLAWASGKYQNARKPTHYTPRVVSDAQKQQIIEAGKAFATAEWMHKISALRDLHRLSEMNRKRMLGTHGFGRGARDRPDHCKALHWIVRDARGFIHEFDNLQSWARANEWRFLPDDRPQSKLPLWRRAVGGINNTQRTDRKGQHHWKGWTLVSVLERKEQGAPDLLARDRVAMEDRLKPGLRAGD